MRQSIAEQPDWVEDDTKVVGFYFGSDFVAEHEWGIKDLKKAFEVTENGSTKVPDIMTKTGTVNQQPAMMIACMPTLCSSVRDYFEEANMRKLMKACDLFITERKTLAASWDGESFAILAIGKENIAKLKEFYNILTTEPVLLNVCVQRDTPFSARCLGICAQRVLQNK